MKILRYVLYGLVAAAVVGLLCWKGFVTRDLTSSDISKAVLILAGMVFSLVRPARRRGQGSKTLYQKAYGEFIRNAFAGEPALERKFYSAVADYNRDKPADGAKKLMKLRGECRNSDDIYAVTVFTGLCLDDMGLYQEAANAYSNALNIRPNATLASNLGLCLQRLGELQAAMEAYEYSVRLDPKNPVVYNNIAALYFRDNDYQDALDYAEKALECNANMKEALATAAMCHALSGNDEKYQHYYRRAVSAGYDGKKLKDAIRQMDATL